MKFKISQEDFSKGLLAVNKSLLAKANLPILANVLVDVSKNELEILSTNLETATRVRLPCKSESEGRVAVSGRILLEFVTQLPEKEISVEKLGEEILVTMEGYSARLTTMIADEFPAIPKIEKGQRFEIAAKEFVGGVGKVAVSAASDEGRPVLTGILWEVSDSEVSMVATDGYRLSHQEVGIKRSGEKLKIVVPARAVVEVVKIITESFENLDNQKIGVYIADSLNQANFSVGNVEFTTRLIEGEFPNWQKIIPTNFLTSVKIIRADFIKLLRMASIFARDSGNIVRLKFENGKKPPLALMTVLASASQVGSNEAKTEVEMTGKGGEIAFNFRYLLEVLAIMEEEFVNFEMVESLNPGRISGDAKGGFFYIVMPVRLQS